MVPVSAARRLRPEVWKNSSTALSSNDGELARSITTCAPATASLRPSPVMVLTPLLGEAATSSWPPLRRMATVFEPIRPVPPMTTIFMVYPPLSKPQAQCLVQFVKRRQGPMVPAADLKASTPLPTGISTLAPFRRLSRDSALAIAPDGQNLTTR